MYRLFILIFIASILPVNPAFAGIECHAKMPPHINVRPSKGTIKYNFTKSKADLNKRDVDTISPYGPQHTTNVSGLMSGFIQLKSKVAFMTETHQYLGRGCVFLKSVDVEINIDPTIFIAKEFPKGGCMHSAILAHEFKHIDADRLIVNKYTNIIGKALGDVIDARGSTYGPMKKNRMAGIQRDVQEALHNVVRTMNRVMNEERRKRQQAIDNLEEYESIGKRCKHSNKHARR